MEICRRTTAEEYHQREERWRKTSATFHDKNRARGEQHDAWVGAELTHQRDLLQSLAVDVKSIMPLLHSTEDHNPPCPNTSLSEQPAGSAAALFQDLQSSSHTLLRGWT